MLATVQQSRSTVLDVPTQNVTLTYNSEATPEFQFTFDTPTGQPYLFVDEETTVIVTLENATFASPPITPISPPTAFSHTLEGNQLSIDVPGPPPDYFHPWAFLFNVNAEGANGVTSPTLYLIQTPTLAGGTASTSIDLQYSLGNGSFTLNPSAISLAHLSVLINNITPFEVNFHLDSDPSVSFNSTPLIGEGGLPSWLTYTGSSSDVTISISSNPGRFASFRFVLDIQSGENTVTVTSPDPILINATIGDG
jgi:hypothetical protein